RRPGFCLIVISFCRLWIKGLIFIGGICIFLNIIPLISNFKTKLEKCGINATIRREMGRDIGGACGQLIGRGAFLTGEAVPKGAVEGQEERMLE
ncbi:hypothetical protein NE634_19470, partial [Lacrimispora saccharolytica]|nr:hypothetical protein [Lacrimispora saccharolytica]